MSLLEVKNLKVNFVSDSGDVQSVRDVSFEIPKGKVVSLVGESGCGKSVTSKSIMRLIDKPDYIDKNTQILFEGKNILDFDDKKLNDYRGKDVSMIFQDALDALNPTIRVGDQVKESLLNHNYKNLNNDQMIKKSIEMIERVGIHNPELNYHKYPFQLSGGMRQRIMIAIAMINSPKLLIADEPTTALDVTIQAQILDLMKEMKESYGGSILMITHDFGVVADISDYVEVMYAGIIIENGTVDDIFYNSKHPYTWALINAAPRMDLSRNNLLYSIEGIPPSLLNPPKGCPFASRCWNCMNICINNMPPRYSVEGDDNHNVSCWLYHPESGYKGIYMKKRRYL